MNEGSLKLPAHLLLIRILTPVDMLLAAPVVNKAGHPRYWNELLSADIGRINLHNKFISKIT